MILDHNTKFTDIKPESKIQCLKDAIYLYDTSCTLKSEPLFLDGGYEAWMWHYPSLVTNPKLPEVNMRQDDVLRGNFFLFHVFANKSVENQKSFGRTSQNWFVLALLFSLYS